MLLMSPRLLKKWVPRPLRTLQRAGNHERIRTGIKKGNNTVSAASYPPLHKTQGRGTPECAMSGKLKAGPPARAPLRARTAGGNRTGSIASHTEENGAATARCVAGGPGSAENQLLANP